MRCGDSWLHIGLNGHTRREALTKHQLGMDIGDTSGARQATLLCAASERVAKRMVRHGDGVLRNPNQGFTLLCDPAVPAVTQWVAVYVGTSQCVLDVISPSVHSLQ